MENTGTYVSYKELLERLYPSSYVTKKGTLALSNKSGNVFEYTSSLTPLEVGDTVCQGSYVQTIKAILTTPDRIELHDATDFVDGEAYVFRTSLTKQDMDLQINVAMQTIDLYTGQWFNKREFTGANKLKFEGSNTHILHFSVPIIEIISLAINEEDTVMPVEDYRVFNSRTLPDDRRNPRIKLISDSLNIYRTTMGSRSGRFGKFRWQFIEGSFGFLEPDGSTPEGIKWATVRLVMKQLTTDLESDATAAGEVKREKVDMHEIEYFQSSDGSDSSSGSSGSGAMTGDEEVDKILKMYKAPLAITGTDPLHRDLHK